ncbi:ATP-dependent helicase [Mangrovibacterium lignilyticum]|uniref:ATP-dependent helicase n=1 Tax=Mangrovibacterium lignilyticum TaxID=2668052 RepID=UPI0013CFAC5D|nr:ATP-dependent helicase [Mangrovibacterium lignilyticum]
MSLSELQQQIVDARGKVVVKACPGSGKTYSVAARIATLLKQDFHHQGIAAISFSNTAWKEINEKLTDDFGIRTPLPYPHFVGTIDSFLNKYVFLPFGHLVLGTKERPNLVGEPHSKWSGRFYADSFFDDITFDIKGSLAIRKGSQIPLRLREGKGNVFWAKMNLIRRGFCNQSDANFHSMMVLKEFPLFAQNLVNRFPYLVVDEAQDTNDIQMEIINILVSNGLKEVMLIGDPNQAIFEWNEAKPSLFLDKYKEWTPLDLDINRRSSSNICSCTNTLIGEDVSKPNEKGEVFDFTHTPRIIAVEYEEGMDFQVEIITPFLKECADNGIDVNTRNVAVLYRSKSFQKYFGRVPNAGELPWKNGFYHIRDIVQGKYLYEEGLLKDGFRLVEQGLYKGLQQVAHARRADIKKEEEKEGFVQYRKMVYDFISLLPDTKNVTLSQWINDANDVLKELQIEIGITKAKSNVPIESLFSDVNTHSYPYYHGTIHSAKGCTFEGVLLLISEHAGTSGKYKNFLKTDYWELTGSKQEEIRAIYVAMTRPRKVLNIVVPAIDEKLWKDRLQLT